MSLVLNLYRTASGLAEPLAGSVLRGRAKRGKEDAARLGERLGRPSTARPEGPLVWFHAASVGESLSILPLVERLRTERPEVGVLVTSGTVTSADLLQRRLPKGAIHQYSPVDGPAAAKRFVGHWRPDVAVFVESELWPNLLREAKKRGTKLALLSARITAESAAGWRRAPNAARSLLSGFDLIMAQDHASKDRLAELGGDPAGVANLKLVGAPLNVDRKARAALAKAIGQRPVLLAASTHPGEEALISEATPPASLLIVAPRHPVRGESVAEILRARDLKVVRRAAGETPDVTTDVYVADTLGEMGLFYALADVAVMGGSFAPGIGGHNPLEPARLGVPVVTGPETFNFAEVYAAMVDVDAAVVATAGGLENTLAHLFADVARRKAMSDAAVAFAAVGSDALETTWLGLKSLLKP